MHFAQNSRVGISIEMVCNKRRAQKHDEYVFFCITWTAEKMKWS